MTTEEFIKRIMEAHNLDKTASVKRASSVLCVAEVTVWQWLAGTRKPSKMALRLMEVLVRIGEM